MGNRYRNEQKYLLNKSDVAILKMRLDAMMEKDPHVRDGTSYLIRSVYFDDMYNSCLHEKEDGVNFRRKWRIRIYNCSDKVIHLECKEKAGNMTHKDSITVSREDVEAALSGNIKPDKSREPLWNDFAMQVMTKGFRPATIVQYERIPYIWRPSNVRITIDRCLSSSEIFDRFFDDDLPVRPIMARDLDLLEVKYDTLLPDHLRQVMNLKNMRYTSFSKYELCRRMPMRAF